MIGVQRANDWSTSNQAARRETRVILDTWVDFSEKVAPLRVGHAKCGEVLGRPARHLEIHTPEQREMKLAANAFRLTFVACMLGGLAITTGCDTKEEIVDIETPAGEVEVNRDTATDGVEVDVSENE